MLIANQNRGNHATGLALQQADGSIDVCKKDVPAWNFVASDGFKKFIEEKLQPDTLCFIGHTRQATQGLPKHNENNHPMWSGKTAVVHNGMISNDDYLFRELKMDRKAETDSDVIRAVLDQQGFTPKAVGTLGRLSGSAAFAAVSTEYPGKLMLGRSGNPIVLCLTDDQLLWSSERDPIHKALRPYEKRFGFIVRKTKVDAGFIPMGNDSAYLIGNAPKNGGHGWAADWLEWHYELKISAWQNTNITRTYAIHDTYRGMRIQKYGDTNIDVVQCPNPKCGEWILTGKVGLDKLKRWKCKACKTRLVAE